MARLADVAFTMSHFRDIEDVSREVFGPLYGSKEEQLQALQASYRRISLDIHPDRYAGRPDANLANETFIKITRLRDQMEARIRGQALPALPGPPGSHYSEELVTRRNTDLRPWSPAPPERETTGYDEPPYPPLPNCVCLGLARKNLPYRTIFYFANPTQEYATISGQRKNLVTHATECTSYRSLYSATTKQESTWTTGAMAVMMLRGWYWQKMVL